MPSDSHDQHSTGPRPTDQRPAGLNRSSQKPAGLYRPEHERDACGVGFVCHMKGVPSHDIIRDGLTILKNLHHRGAVGADPETGDGSGILMQIPDAFLRQEVVFDLPNRGKYGVGVAFLPRDVDQRNRCGLAIEQYVANEGQQFLGWRDVPTDNRCVGHGARAEEPAIRQFFVGNNGLDADAFERKLYVIRKQVERAVRGSGMPQAHYFYIPSLSCRTLVYKGQLMAHQVDRYFPDLNDPAMVSAIALVHQRYATNTFPSWGLAQPFRFIAHNGEINTVIGNRKWMQAREAALESGRLGRDIPKLFPIVEPGMSDSASFDNVFELLVQGGRSLPHAAMMMIPEAWGMHDEMDQARRDFYEFHAKLMEPWDGPAAMAFTDGRVVGATLDRNGLRPARYMITKDDRIIMASEAGVLDVPADQVVKKWRLQPGRMLLVDTVQGRIVDDEELKDDLAQAKPYGRWLVSNQLHLARLDMAPVVPHISGEELLAWQKAFGYSHEDLHVILAPMADRGEEPIGSMGNDTALAVLSDRPQQLFNYFRQLFAQVTNPPIDPIREEIVMSTGCAIGSEHNLLRATPTAARRIRLETPLLTNREMAMLREVELGGLNSITLPMLFPIAEGAEGLERAVEALCAQAAEAIRQGCTVLILSDRGMDRDHAPIPSLLATAAVHNHLIREGLRTRCGFVIETAEAREVMHFALLIGYGAGAINPYLALDTIEEMAHTGFLPGASDVDDAHAHFIKAVKKGMLKVMSKMGISTVQSYRGAQVFEALGLQGTFVEKYFTGTSSRLEGIGIVDVAADTIRRHLEAFSDRPAIGALEHSGQYQWRRGGEFHQYNPEVIAKLQDAVRRGSYEVYKEYAQQVDDSSRRLATLRGLMELKWAKKPIPLEEVEPASEIVKRFCTGAMSFGSISKEAHENLAIAMNRLGGRSNTGEGGEDPERFVPDADGNLRRSAIKQVASGRFGVTSHYLTNADELQIKIAQGAKPGEGGQLPGHKVNEVIARVRHSTPGVGLISPPPHHDIYSIEDLAQLIFDLKNSNPAAAVSVKLVAEVGVGTIAAGVAKGHADLILISGHDGGTGASPISSVRHAGGPWELGLAETQQVLVMNELRGRVRLQTDGQLKTGRDVVIGALLGADEFGFATAPLVASGCIMMRKCHLNTCPVGIATQDEDLRKRFPGKPEHVINFFRFVAKDVREIMARLGFRTFDEMVGRVDRLIARPAIDHWKAKGLDLTAILHRVDVPEGTPVRHCEEQDHGIDQVLDNKLIALAEAALERGERVEFKHAIRNTDRTVGAMLGHEVSKRYGEKGLPDDTLHLKLHGTAGQSFGAFVPRGITLELVGDANDYTGKGLSGGRIIVRPPRAATFRPERNIIVGNTVLYGATSGEAYFCGVGGERFAVRNSGARTVVEGVGDHGCEYMTGGRVVVLGKTGRNFAAGMSGGVAYVFDPNGRFAQRCNTSMVELSRLSEAEDLVEVRELLERHLQFTGSNVASEILEDWEESFGQFIKVFPLDYKRVLAERAGSKARAKGADKAVAAPAGKGKTGGKGKGGKGKREGSHIG
ncbi:MAG: glutamate synthase large subunit [Nitrospirota bacterium]|nr:glutamate synthase large subunit [Nitrospirota bacterium]